MPENTRTYEVKAHITVEALNEEDALAKAEELLDMDVSPRVYQQISIEGEGAVYEVEDF